MKTKLGKSFRKIGIVLLSLFAAGYSVVASEKLRSMFMFLFAANSPSSISVNAHPSPIYMTGEHPLVQISCGPAFSYRVSVYSKDDPALQALRTKNAGTYIPDCPYPDFCSSEQLFAALPQAHSVATVTGHFTGKEINSAEALVRLPSDLPPGDYFAVAQAKGWNSDKFSQPDITFFRKSDLGLIVKDAPDRMLVKAVGLNDGKAREGVKLQIYDNETAGKPKFLAKATTGHGGFTEIVVPNEYRDNNVREFVITARDGTNMACRWDGHSKNWQSQEVGHDFSFNSSQRYRCDIVTDRTAYRLGNKVFYKAALRELGSDGLQNIGAGRELTVSFLNQEGTNVGTQELRSDKFGAINGSFTIPSSGQTGSYTLQIDGGAQQFSRPINVMQYRKPEYEVSVTPLAPYTVAGDRVKLKLHANYYFGAPVTQASVKYTISCEPNWMIRERLQKTPDYYHFYANAQSAQWYSSGSRSFDYNGSVVTDDNGDAIVEFTSPKPNQARADRYDDDYIEKNYTVNASVTDLSRKTVEGSGTALVTAADFCLLVKLPQSVVPEGSAAKIEVEARSYDGKPVANKRVRLSINRWQRKSFSNNFEEVVEQNQELTLDANGRASLLLPMKPESPTETYFVQACSIDDHGHPVRTVSSFWYAGKAPYYATESEQPIKIVPDKPVYKAGDRARILIVPASSYKGSAEVLACVQGTTLHSFQNVDLQGKAKIVEIPIEMKHAPYAYFEVNAVGSEHNPITASATLPVYPEQALLSIAINSNKESFRPKDKATYTITARRADGKPSKNTSLALALVDESIFAVSPDTNPDLAHALFAENEDWVKTSWSFEGLSTPYMHEPKLWTWWWPFSLFSLGGQEECCRQRACTAISFEGAPEASNVPVRDLSSAPGGPRQQEAQQVALCGFEAPRTVPRVRSDFRDSAAWIANTVTDAAGKATVSVVLPDNLTTWRATVNALDTGNSMGTATKQVVTSRDLMARLSLPRFFTDGDKGFITGIIHNYTNRTQNVIVTLSATKQFNITEALKRTVTVPAKGIKRCDWPMTVVAPGKARIKFEASGQTDGDALAVDLPVVPFEYTEFFAKSGVLTKDAEQQICSMMIPADADPAQAKYKLSLAGSRIGPVLGNFDTLIDYPYGCTEQTMSRLTPSVVALQLHKKLGLPLSESSKTRFNNVYHMAMTKLLQHQHGDGGWGWWENDNSNPYLTAYVMEGLWLQKQVGYSVDQNMIDRGMDSLREFARNIFSNPWEREGAIDHAKVLYVLTLWGDKLDPSMKAWQMAKLNGAPPEAVAYLTMACQQSGDKQAAKLCLAKLLSLANVSYDFVDWDHTEKLKKRMGFDGSWDYTYRYTGVESTAIALRAIVATDPDNKNIELIRRWILLQRTEQGWNDTKTTAQVFLALLDDELATRGSRQANFVVTAQSADKLLGQFAFNQSTIYQAEKLLDVMLNSHDGKFTLHKKGPGRLYYSSMLTCVRPLKVKQERFAKCIPSELKMQRQFFRLIRQRREDGQIHTSVIPIKQGMKVKAGEVILMKVLLETPISLPYVMVEAPLPAGGEVTSEQPINVDNPQMTSAGNDDSIVNFWWTHQDVLDDRIAFFVTELQPGKCQFETTIRMEMPGTFNVVPVNMHAMYTEKVKGYTTPDALEVAQ